MLPHYSKAAAAAAAAAATAWTSGTSPGEPAVRVSTGPGLSPPVSEAVAFKLKNHPQYLGSSGSDHSGAPDSEHVLLDDSSIARGEVRLNTLNESGRKSYACTLCDFSTKQKGLLKARQGCICTSAFR